MDFNTVILYDIENLIGGYGNNDIISKISLKEIHEQILKKDIGDIAIQRAYANWANPKLNTLKNDIVELGIDPIQMFGFGKGYQKNASDIQLAIDAVDIALTKSVAEIFVIVSGDGGFSTLAKKLHEYGKMVIGCSFEKTTSKVFATICDDFIYMKNPKMGLPKSSEYTDPIVLDFIRHFDSCEVEEDQIIDHVSEIFKFLSYNWDSSYLLKTKGLNISILSQILSYRIKDFDYKQLGFTNFVDFIRYSIRNEEIKLVLSPPSDYRLLFNDSKMFGFENVELIWELNSINTPENYKRLLKKSKPVFLLSNNHALFEIIQCLSDNSKEYQDILIEDILLKLEQHFFYNHKDINNAILTLISAGCFTSDNEELHIKDQRFSFVYDSIEEAVETLKSKIHSQLENILINMDEDVFEEIFI